MNKIHIDYISKQLGLTFDNTENTMELLENGATIPFISRYRKELTGSMDEVAVASVKNWVDKLVEIDKRRETIARRLFQPKLLSFIEAAATLL